MNQEVDDLPGLTAPDPALVRGDALHRKGVRRTSWRVGALVATALVAVGVFVSTRPSSPEPVETVDAVAGPEVVDGEPDGLDVESAPEVVEAEPEVIDVEPEPDGDDVEPEPTVDLSGPKFAPDAEFIFTGTWSPVVLRVHGDTIDLTQIPDADMTVTGRLFWSNDGCNGSGGAPILPGPDGRIELIPGASTAMGCFLDGQPDASFGTAIRDATSWGVTQEGQLVLVGTSTYVRFERTETMALSPIDGEWILRGITEGIDGQGEVEVGDNEVRLTVAGSDAALESVDCDKVLTFSIEVGPNRSEGTFRASAVDPSGCDPLSLVYKAASFLAVSDYYLGAEGFLVFWQGPNQRLAWQRADS